MATLNDLSPELLYLIFDNVYEEDAFFYSIKNCSLVNRTWYNAAIKFVFRRCIFRIDHTTIYTPDQVQYITERQDLHGCVKEVHIILGLNRHSYCPSTLEKAFEILLPKLVRLERIFISANYGVFTHLNTLGKGFLQALYGHQNKPKIFLEKCATYSSTGSVLPQIENTQSLQLVLSAPEHEGDGFPSRVRERRRGSQPDEQLKLTGSRCVVEILDKIKTIRQLGLSLGEQRGREYDHEAATSLSVIGPLLANIERLSLAGEFRLSSSVVDNLAVERLQSLSLVSAYVISAFVRDMTGRLPFLEELRLSTRNASGYNVRLSSFGHRFEQYYRGDSLIFAKFISSLPLKRLTMCGFQPTLVRHALSSLTENLEELHIHDLDIFSDRIPQVDNIRNRWVEDDSSDTDDMPGFVHRAYSRWPALRQLKQHNDPEVYEVYSKEVCHVFRDVGSTATHDQSMATIGIDVERYHLVTDPSETVEQPTPGRRRFRHPPPNPGGSRAEPGYVRARRQRIEELSGHLEEIENLIANFEILTRINAMANLQQLYIHVHRIDTKNYWFLTIKEAVQTFAYIHKHKVGAPLLKLHITNILTQSRYFVKSIGSGRVITRLSRDYDSIGNQVWDLNPIRRLTEEESMDYDSRFGWEYVWALQA